MLNSTTHDKVKMSGLSRPMQPWRWPNPCAFLMGTRAICRCVCTLQRVGGIVREMGEQHHATSRSCLQHFLHDLLFYSGERPRVLPRVAYRIQLDSLSSAISRSSRPVRIHQIWCYGKCKMHLSCAGNKISSFVGKFGFLMQTWPKTLRHRGEPSHDHA